MKALKKIILIHIPFLPVLIYTIFCLYTMFSFFQSKIQYGSEVISIELNIKHYLAFLSIVINVIVYFFYRSFYKYSLLATITLGIFNLLNFSLSEISWSIAISSIKINFQPISSFVAIIALIINLQRNKESQIENTINSHQNVSPQSQIRINDEIEKFKSLYKNFTEKNLEEIINDKKYTSNAKNAAQLILNEKKENI